jgi:hypothetical protein
MHRLSDEALCARWLEKIAAKWFFTSDDRIRPL